MKITKKKLGKSLFLHFRDLMVFGKRFSYHFYIGKRGIFGFFAK